MILTINSGSSSLKYQLFDNKLKELKNGEGSLSEILAFIQDKKVEKIVYRIVHGGEIHEPLILNERNLKKIEKLNDYAPLHNPKSLEIIRKVKRQVKKTIKHIGVFDTAFHNTIPEKNFTYAIPYELSKKHGLRKYGFHGLSHEYLTLKIRKILGVKKSEKLVTVHLGSGSSISAILKGKSLDNSLGFSPNEGLVMATRSGDIDPGIIWFMSNKLKYSNKKIDEILNKKSGLLGISGKTSRMEDLVKSKSIRDKLAIDVFVNHIVQTIGAYITQLGGIDALVFSGGIGENENKIRRNIIDKLALFGLKIDAKLNKRQIPEDFKISAKGSKPIYVIHTNEGYILAKNAQKIK